jgi:hypothetical protein
MALEKRINLDLINTRLRERETWQGRKYSNYTAGR